MGHEVENVQHKLFHEDIYAALTTCVMSIGTPQQVGAMLWGESVSPSDAGRKTAHCLNREHAQKFSPEEILWILRKAHDVGCHAGMNFIARDAGYSDPAPLVVEDEAAQLQREFVAGLEHMESLAKRMEALVPRLRPVA